VFNEISKNIFLISNSIFKSPFVFHYNSHRAIKIDKPSSFNVLNYKSENTNYSTFNDYFINFNFEIDKFYRFQKFTNPVFKYDYKAGDYFPKINKELYTYLFTTIANITNSIRTSP